MTARNYLFLSIISIAVIFTSCDKNQNKATATIATDFSVEKARTDSVLHGIKQQTKTFTIDPSKRNTLLSKKGIMFSIPENAFVTDDGQLPTKKITLTISEYHNPADILVSGIPMQYKTATGAVQMESAGMFNIEAEVRGKPLQLANGKVIDVQVPSKKKDPDFNLYYFDPITNEWKQTQENLPVTNTDETATQNTSKIEQVSGTNVKCEPGIMSIEWASLEAVKRTVNGNTITLVKPVCAFDDAFFNFPIVTNKFPELLLYKEIVWVGSSKQTDKLVSAAFENDALLSASILEREIPFNKYLIAFEFKHTKFNAYMSVASKADMCEINDEIYTSLYEQRPTDEKKIEHIQTKQKKKKKEDALYRSFEINKLGVWNCDRLYLLTKKVVVYPRFRNKSTNEFYTATTTFLIDKKINSVWTYSNAVTLNPDSDNLLVFVNSKGKLCCGRLNKLSDTTSASRMNLVIDVTESADQPDNTDELNLLLKGV